MASPVSNIVPSNELPHFALDAGDIDCAIGNLLFNVEEDHCTSTSKLTDAEHETVNTYIQRSVIVEQLVRDEFDNLCKVRDAYNRGKETISRMTAICKRMSTEVKNNVTCQKKMQHLLESVHECYKTVCEDVGVDARKEALDQSNHRISELRIAVNCRRRMTTNPLCPMCYESISNRVLLPCGHCLCDACLDKAKPIAACFFCRAMVDSINPLYII